MLLLGLKYLQSSVNIIISDDGYGFKDIVDKLGEPYIPKNNQEWAGML